MFRNTPTRSTLAMCVASAAVFGTGHAVAAPAPTQNEPHQSSESFAAAVRDSSSSPFYVLITVVDDATGQARTGCTHANFLLGAIHKEFGLTYDTAAIANAQDRALSNTSHVFHFSKPEALKNVAFRYTPQQLDTARQLIQSLNEQQLRDGVLDRDELRTISIPVQDARACALIERGWSVRMQDLTGNLMVDR